MKLNEKNQEQFREDGFTIIPDFLNSIELEIVRKACNESIEIIERDMMSRGITEDRINVFGKKYFINNARHTHPELLKIVFSEKNAAVCKATIGANAYLHNEQFVVKMTDQATNFAWHQDSGYSVYQGGAELHEPYVTFWIALDDMSYENGTISVLPFRRSPSRGLIEHFWDNELNSMVGYSGEDEGDLIEVKAGTLVVFSSFLLHKSGSNRTNKPRRSYFIAFTPQLFTYSDKSKGIYSSGEPLLLNGHVAV